MLDPVSPKPPCTSVKSKTGNTFEKPLQAINFCRLNYPLQRSTKLPDLSNSKINYSDFPGNTLKKEVEQSSLSTVKPWNYGPKLSRNRSDQSPYSGDSHSRRTPHTNSSPMGSCEKNSNNLTTLTNGMSIDFSKATNTAPATGAGTSTSNSTSTSAIATTTTTTTTTTTSATKPKTVPIMATAATTATKMTDATVATKTTRKASKSHRIVVGFQTNSKRQKEKLSPAKFMTTPSDLDVKPAKNFRTLRLHPMKFLHSDTERRLFEKQRTVIYALNAIMRDSEKSKYEAFIKSRSSGDKTPIEG